MDLTKHVVVQCKPLLGFSETEKNDSTPWMQKSKENIQVDAIIIFV